MKILPVNNYKEKKNQNYSVQNKGISFGIDLGSNLSKIMDTVTLSAKGETVLNKFKAFGKPGKFLLEILPFPKESRSIILAGPTEKVQAAIKKITDGEGLGQFGVLAKRVYSPWEEVKTSKDLQREIFPPFFEDDSLIKGLELLEEGKLKKGDIVPPSLKKPSVEELL